MQRLDNLGSIHTIGVAVAKFACRDGQSCKKTRRFFLIKEQKTEKTVLCFAILRKSCPQTIVSTSEGPHSASVLCYGDGVGAAAGHLPHATDVLHQGGHIATLAVTVACQRSK